MKRFICELGGYEVFLHGSASDAKRQLIAHAGDHPVVATHGALQPVVDRLATRWVTGVLWWGPNLGREPTLRWFTVHKLDGTFKSIVGTERERELQRLVAHDLPFAEGVLAAVKEQGAL